MAIYKVKPYTSTSHGPTPVVNLRCPACRHSGAFHGLQNCNDAVWAGPPPRHENMSAGLRRCPNIQCNAIVFVVFEAGKLVESFPPETIDFDATNLPPEILATLEEAIQCNSAKAYKAAALMVRRLLEELCEAKNATGKDLKERLKSLNSTIVVPPELLDAADELRLLGNDAAHVEAKSYNSIGETEAKLAISLAKELLKATYQYSALVDQLRALKKTPP